MKFNIRPCTAADVPQILQFIKDLALFEQEPDAVTATEDKLLSTLGFVNGSTAYAHGLVAESTSIAGELLGMAIYFYNYSTWNGAPGLYLEDLYVVPEYRHHKIGTSLIRALAQECKRIGGMRLEWSVLKWNSKAIDVYTSEAIQAERMDEWVGMRVDGNRLDALTKAREFGL
ncbi:Peroxygenase 1 [Savitreella phatthalungensis]